MVRAAGVLLDSKSTSATLRQQVMATTHNPSKPRLIANLGDQGDPVAYGGYFIYRVPGTREWGRQNLGPGFVGEHWDPSEEGEPYEVYRFSIEEDVWRDLSWAAKDIESIADTYGMGVDEFREMGRSPDVLERAEVYRMVGGHWGFNNLDSDPLRLTEAEMHRRYRAGRISRTHYVPRASRGVRPTAFPQPGSLFDPDTWQQ